MVNLSFNRYNFFKYPQGEGEGDGPANGEEEIKEEKSEEKITNGNHESETNGESTEKGTF